MLRLDVLQNQWLMLAIFWGLVLLLTIVLTYIALWRPRETDIQGPSAGKMRWLVPWVLIVTYVSIGAFTVIYIIRMVAHPPNW